MTPFLLENIGTAAEVRPHDVDPFRLVIEQDNLYYMSWGPRLWHTDGEVAGTFRIGDGVAVEAQPGIAGSIGTISGKIIYLGSDEHLWATDGTTAGSARLMPAQRFMASARCGARLCMSLGDHTLATTDGTPDGTSVIAVTYPPNGMTSFPDSLTTNGAEAFFKGYGESGHCVTNAQKTFCGELWATDGSAAGTRMVRDIVPGPDPSSPEYFFGWNGLVFFRALVSDSLLFGGSSIFVSDGSEAGTRTLLPGHVESIVDANPHFTAAGEYVYFNTLDGRTWRTDGTPEGTQLLSQLIPLGDPATLGTVRVAYSPDFLFLDLYRHENQSVRPDGHEIWSYDGVQTTRIHHGRDSHLLGYFPPSGMTYYLVDDAGDAWVSTLYASDGKGAGTPIAAIDGRAVPLPFLLGNRSAFFLVSAGGGASRHELWQTDGTRQGTHRVPNATITDQGSHPRDLTAWRERVYFFAEDDEGARRLFATRGDGHTTSPIARCGACDRLGVEGGRLFYRNGPNWYAVEESGASTENLGPAVRPPLRIGEVEISWRPAPPDSMELWRSGRPTPLARIAGDGPVDAVMVDQEIYFTANGALWVTDGTTEGTSRLRVSGTEPPLIGLADRLLFLAEGKLWASDGTEAGTVPLGTASGGGLRPLGTAGGVDLFQFAGALWRTDGTPAGTYVLLADEAGREFEFSASLADRVALVRRGDVTGHAWEILTSDGTLDGTRTAITLAAPPRTIDVAEPVQTGDGKWYLPYSDGRVHFLDLETLEPILMEGHAQIPALTPFLGGGGGRHRFAAVGRVLLFAAAGVKTGIELWAADLDSDRPPLPSVSVTFAGTTTTGGKRAAVFRIAANVDGAFAPTVRFETADGTAVAGRDYTPVSGSVSLTESDRTAYIVVPLAEEGRGLFHLLLLSPEHAVVDLGIATASLDAPRRRRLVRR